jgi:CHAD domain-containing protein
MITLEHQQLFSYMRSLVDGEQQRLSSTGVVDDEVVHGIRVMTKKIRACLLLLSGGCPEEKITDLKTRASSLARSLAVQRDSFVMASLIDTMFQGDDEALYQWVKDASLEYVPVCENYQQLRFLQSEILDLENLLVKLEKGCGDIDLQANVAATYKRCRKLSRRAMASGVDGDFHKWRRWTKYLFYQLDYLFHEPEAALYTLSLKGLSDALGDKQDCCVLESHLLAQGFPETDKHCLQALEKIRQRKQQRRDRSLELEKRLLQQETFCGEFFRLWSQQHSGTVLEQ